MFLETICIENGLPQNIDYHLKRMRITSQKYGFTTPPLPNFEELTKGIEHDGKLKCSIIYHAEIIQVTTVPYFPKKINTLKLVHSNIDYGSKFSDRTALNKLLELRGDCDEILIVKNGLITDTSYANVVFKNKKGLFTPNKPLLKGTKRQELIENRKIKETTIGVDVLHTFDCVYLINAMLDIENQEGIAISNIRLFE